MDEKQFDRQVEAFFSRLDGLLDQSRSESAQVGAFSDQAIEELQILAEELQVASEELRQKNEELSESNAAAEADRWRYRELFEFAPDGYITTDSNRLILEANQAAAKMLRVQPNFLPGKPLAAFIYRQDLPGFRTRLSKMRGKPDFRIEDWEIRIQPREAPEFLTALTVASGRFGEGQTRDHHQSPSLRWMLRDITEREHARQALQATKDNLEMRVAERTQQLSQANENLKRFSLQLSRKNRDLEDFASITSHDLQEPLRKIQSFGKLLSSHKGEALGNEDSDYVERMVGAAARMQDMVLDLLQYAQLSTRSGPFYPVDLNQIAGEVVADLETAIYRSGGRVEVGDLPTIEANSMQMRQLLQNLIANALKFRRPEIAPLVRVWSHQRTPQMVDVYVEDYGIGLDPQYQDLIFQPFHRLHGRSEYEGTGMGLSICRKIAERHGGEIHVTSRPEGGSTFTVTLPLAQGRHEPGSGADGPA